MEIVLTGNSVLFSTVFCKKQRFQLFNKFGMQSQMIAPYLKKAVSQASFRFNACAKTKLSKWTRISLKIILAQLCLQAFFEFCSKSFRVQKSAWWWAVLDGLFRTVMKYLQKMQLVFLLSNFSAIRCIKKSVCLSVRSSVAADDDDFTLLSS